MARTASVEGSSRTAWPGVTIQSASDVADTPIADQLAELGAQLDWVRDYL